MAEDRTEPREFNYRQWLPWTQIFRGFWVAMDLKKLLLAAGGILVMTLGWWALAAICYNSRDMPVWATARYAADRYKDAAASSDVTAEQLAWRDFKQDRNHWNLLHEAAGDEEKRADAGDLAESLSEYNVISELIENRDSFVVDNTRYTVERIHGRKRWAVYHPVDSAQPVRVVDFLKRAGTLRTLPFYEDRGPNPFLLVTGKAGHPDSQEGGHYVPWQRGEFLDWLFRDQIPVLIEPLVKFLRPLFYLLNPNAGYLERFYFLLVIIWTLATWAIFGGAITRIAAVELARNEKISLRESFRYTVSRWRSYLFASFAPLIGVAAITIVLILFSLIALIPIVAEVWYGVLWWIALGLGLAMAVILIGLVGWPMIHATLSAEGSDSFDALSRCYSYVLQKPWSYLWYAVVALVYGAVVVFFVVLMGSMTVYLAKWGVSQNPLNPVTNRDPTYMFEFAPTSFGWNDLLTQGQPRSADWHPWNYIGAVLVGFWLWVAFLLMIGFSYAYFWSSSTIIYLLMRRKVDDTDFDEVYLEDEDLDESYSAAPAPTSASPQPAAVGAPLQMVEAPTLRTPSTPVESPTAPTGDGNAGTTP
jgi:hypothetical protein